MQGEPGATGEGGPMGSKGENGIPGPRGDVGDQGRPGETGIQGTHASRQFLTSYKYCIVAIFKFECQCMKFTLLAIYY